MAATAPFQQTIGTSSSQGTASAGVKGFIIKAHPDNTGIIYQGVATGVTTGTGFPLAAGEARFISPGEIQNHNGFWYIASAASQVLCVIPLN